MKKIFLSLLAAVLFAPALFAATSNSFTAVGAGTVLNIPPQVGGTYTVTGTFVGTLVLQTSQNGGQTWTTLTTTTTTVSSTNFFNAAASVVAYRWSCTAYTSGTAVAAVSQNPIIYLQQLNPAGVVVFQVDSTGVTSNQFFGPISGGGAISGTTGTFSGLITGQGGLTLSGGALAITAQNITTDTTTGVSFGGATTQKLSFYGVTPIVQPTGDVITALTNLGLVGSPTIAATDGLDGTFSVNNTADPTKQFNWSLGAMTTGKVITLTAGAQTINSALSLPVLAATDTLETVGAAQTISGAKTFSAVLTSTNTTSATTSLLGAVVIGNGTAATSIGMGAGNINVGGTIQLAGFLTATCLAGGTAVIQAQNDNSALGRFFCYGSTNGGTLWGTSVNNGAALLCGGANGTNLFIGTSGNSGNIILGINTTQIAEYTSTAYTLSSGLTATFSNTTDATTTSAAANVMSGGLAVGKQLRVGGTVTLSGILTVPGATTPVLTATTTVTTGAGSSAGTLTNAPSVGNPTKWIPFNDAGVTRYIPSW